MPELDGVSGSAPAAPMDTASMILADLGGSEPTGTVETAATETPAVDPAVAAEIAGVPDDEEEAEAPAVEEVAADPRAEEDDAQKPDIPDLKESRWKRVHSGYRWAQEVGKALGIVGEDNRVDVTLFPSVEEMKGMRSAYSDRLAMEHDFSSGRPENAQTFVENWNNYSPTGMAAVAAKLPEILAAANPEGYNALATPVIQRFIDYAYQQGNATQDAAQRDYILGVARAMEWWATGGYEKGTYRTDVPQQPQAPTAVEQELAQARAELARRDGAGADARWKTFSSEVGRKISTDMHAEIDKAVAQLKPHYPNELSYQAVRKAFVDRLQQALKQDASSGRQYQIAEERARASQTPADRDNLHSLYMTMARRAIQTIRGPFVSEASKGIKQVSDARHAQLQNGASKTAPTSGGAPRPQSIAPPLTRKSTESVNEFQHRQIAHDLSA